MTELTSGIENKSIGRMSSFKKLLKSPSRTSPKSQPKRSKSAFSRFFSKKKSDKYDDESSVSFHHKDVEHGEEEFESPKDNISSHIKEDANTKTSADEEKNHDMIQVTQEVVITNENLYNEIKEGMAKVHEGLDKVVHAFDFAAITNEKSLDVRQLPQHENNALKIVEQLQEVATNDPSSIEQVTIEVVDNLEKTEPFSMKNEGTFNDKDIKEEKKTKDNLEKIEPFPTKNEEIFNDEDIKEEKKTEDNCVSSLAQGLGKICTLWSTNK